MPVSTRSQISDGRNEPNPAICHRPRPPSDQEGPPPILGPSLLRNPHHGLKEKMRALTQYYEQHQNQMAGSKNPSSQLEKQALSSHHPSVELLDSNWKKRGRQGGEGKKERKGDSDTVMSENVVPMSPSGGVKKKPTIFPIIDSKENLEVHGQDRITVYSCPKKEMTGLARKLSMAGMGIQSDGKIQRGKRNGGEMGSDLGNSEAGSRIMVFVRLRPMAEKEKEAGSRCCVRIVNKRDVYLSEFASETDYLRLKRLRGWHFSFDASFPDSTTQQEVYATTTAELVEGVLQGRNGSVFCYGATGAGKTYTMLGTVENPGVMVLAIKDLFSMIRQRSCDGNHLVHLSYLEVYNESVRDLLSPGRPLVLREDKQGIVATGLTQYRAYSTDEVMALLQRGNQNRTTEPTRANETSSRSHAILQVVAEYREKNLGNVITRVGKLSLIDLAGSERALATDQRTQRSIEGANINRSLLALSSCINSLVEGKKHIPYRNSKLTQLLKDSLGGHCNSVMIANISPSNLSFGETQNTLHWADRAKEIKTKASTANEEVRQMPESATDQAKLLLELQKENGELRRQVACHQKKLLTAQAQALTANFSPAAPSPVSSPLMSPPCSTQRRVKRSILSGNCFSTPPSKKRGADDTAVRELHKKVKALEVEIERLKKEHILQIKQKDDFIRELITRNGTKPAVGVGTKTIVTRASLHKADRPLSETGDLKSPSHRFESPVPTAKKRSFWDIAAANSPSVVKANGRKLRTLVASETATQAPSMLLQPGFARQRP